MNVIRLDAEREQLSDATLALLSVAGSASAEETARLIREGADVNAVVREDELWRGWTPLMLAAKSNKNSGVLQILMAAGANVNISNESGWTPLMAAALTNANPDVLKVLIAAGADVNAVDKYGMTPLMCAASNNLAVEILRVLVCNGADVNASVKSDGLFPGQTPLMLAAEKSSNTEALKFLLDSGADVSVRDANGKSALDYAEKAGKIEALKK